MRRYRIPAIDRLGRDSLKIEMAKRGYENIERTLHSWIQRRSVPDTAKMMMLEMAKARPDVTLDISEDFDVRSVTVGDAAEADAA